MITPIVMLVALILCLYFMFGRGGGVSPCQHPGAHRSTVREVESALDILNRQVCHG